MRLATPLLALAMLLSAPEGAARAQSCTARSLPGGGEGCLCALARDERSDYPCAGCSLFVPAGLDPATPAPLVVALHGDGGSTAPLHILAALEVDAAPRGMLVWAPRVPAPYQSWRTWANGPDYDPGWIEDRIDEIAADHALDRARLYLAGQSGGSTFLGHYAPTHAETFAGVAYFAGGEGYCSERSALRRSYCGDVVCPPCEQRASMFFGDRDRVYPRSSVDRLHAYHHDECGAPGALHLMAGVGHSDALCFAQTRGLIASLYDDWLAHPHPCGGSAPVDPSDAGPPVPRDAGPELPGSTDAGPRGDLPADAGAGARPLPTPPGFDAGARDDDAGAGSVGRDPRGAGDMSLHGRCSVGAAGGPLPGWLALALLALVARVRRRGPSRGACAVAIAAGLLPAAACTIDSAATGAVDAGSPSRDALPRDTGPPDAGGRRDAGRDRRDGGADAGPPGDAPVDPEPDAGGPPDAGRPDAGPAPDAGAPPCVGGCDGTACFDDCGAPCCASPARCDTRRGTCCVPSCPPGACGSDGCGGVCTCARGEECVDGACGSCGDLGDACCARGVSCTRAWSSCVTGECVQCGGPGQPCCDDGMACRPGQACDERVCVSS